MSDQEQELPFDKLPFNLTPTEEPTAPASTPAAQETDKNQLTLFQMPEWWEEHWKGMPEFVQRDMEPFKTVYVHFANREDYDKFVELMDQPMTGETRAIWFPYAERDFNSHLEWVQRVDAGPVDGVEITED